MICACACRRPAEAGSNPGNNLHVSGLSSKVDNKDLEIAFSKYGKVSVLPKRRSDDRVLM